MKNKENTPYLDPAHSMGYLSRLSFRAFSRALEKRTIKHGISGGQWRFLRVLWEEEGLSQRQLSELVNTKEPTTVRAVRSLEENGLIKRTQDPVDGRKFNIFLTPKSRSLRNKLMPYVIEVNQIASQGVSKKDLDTTRRVLIKMYENLR